MDRASQEGIERYKAAMERIRSGRSDSEEVELPSGRVLLTADPRTPNGVKIEVLESGETKESRKPPDPEALGAMERAREVMERFRAGEIEEAEIPLPAGGTVRLRRDHRAPGAFTVRTPEGGPSMLSIPFEPRTTRPEGFPDDLPFLFDAASAVTSVEGQAFRTVTWYLPGDPRERLEELRRQLTEMGWQDGGESTVSTALGTMTVIESRRGGMTRTLMVSRFGEQSQIRLMEQPKRTGGHSSAGDQGSAGERSNEGD